MTQLGLFKVTLQTEPGWVLGPCVGDNSRAVVFDAVVLEKGALHSIHNLLNTSMQSEDTAPL